MNKFTGVLLISAMALAASAGVAPATHAADAAVNLRRTVTVEVVEKTKDAVVYISSTKIVAQRFSPFGNDPFSRSMPTSRCRLWNWATARI